MNHCWPASTLEFRPGDLNLQKHFREVVPLNLELWSFESSDWRCFELFGSFWIILDHFGSILDPSPLMSLMFSWGKMLESTGQCCTWEQEYVSDHCLSQDCYKIKQKKTVSGASNQKIMWDWCSEWLLNQKSGPPKSRMILKETPKNNGSTCRYATWRYQSWSGT